MVVLVTLILGPLVYFKAAVPAFVYILLLLILHLIFLVVYLLHVRWGELLSNKIEFSGRLLAVFVFAYFLAALKFSSSFGLMVLALLGAIGLHSLILLMLMGSIEVV